MIGVVKNWVELRGYGFIARDGADDVFVHRSKCPGVALYDGASVSFDLMENPRKPGKFEATNVKLLDANAGPIRFGEE